MTASRSRESGRSSSGTPGAASSRPRCRSRRGVTREETALDLFECIEVVHNRARIRSVLGYLSPTEFEEANWLKENSRSEAAQRLSMDLGQIHKA